MALLTNRCYGGGTPVASEHMPAMLRLSAPGAQRAWCGGDALSCACGGCG